MGRPAQPSKFERSDESWDMISDLKHLAEIPRVNNRNTKPKRNSKLKKNPDLADWVIVSSNLSMPKKNNKIEAGYEEIRRRLVEASAKKEFEKSDAAGKLALYKNGVMRPISEDRLELLRKEVATAERLAREEAEDAEFVIAEHDDADLDRSG